MTKVRFSRRRFMKTGLACLAGTAVNKTNLQAGSPKSSRRAVSRTSLKTLQAIPTTCQQCPAGCGIIAYLDGDRCVQVLGNPDHPVNKGGICARGIAALNLVNDPERLLFPMKRLGKRGEGVWSRITWDEAYRILASRLASISIRDNGGGLVFDKENTDPLLDTFIKAIGTASVIDRPIQKNILQKLANWMTTGASTLLPDIARSRTIFNFGANPLAHHDFFLGMSRSLVQARVQRGARLTTFDVRLSETATKSDAWIPLKAGTDASVALAMAHVILKRDLADSLFHTQNTRSSLAMLKERLSVYSPESVEKICGIKADKIEDMALEFATRKPSVAIIGGGVEDHENGIQNIRCVLLLNALVGNLEKTGGLFFPRSPLPPVPSDQESQGIKGVGDLIDTGTEIDAYVSILSNPTFAEPECRTVKEFLQDLSSVKFSAVWDTHLTETALLADLVLPAATGLEGWGMEYAPTLDQTRVLNLRQPAVSLISPARILRSPDFETGKLTEPSFRPKGEAKEIGEVCIELARRMGGRMTDIFPFKNTYDFVSHQASQISGLSSAGGFRILQKKGFWLEKPGPEIQEKIPRPAGPYKIEVTRDDLEKRGISSWPDYQPVIPFAKSQNTEFVLTTFKSSLYGKDTANSKWLKEISHENPVWINRQAAQRYAIKNGDRVRISSSTGSIEARALVTDRIHPGSVALAEGHGHKATGNIARGIPFKSADDDTLLLWWHKEARGVNPHELIARRWDASGRAYATKDTLVQIEKI